MNTGFVGSGRDAAKQRRRRRQMLEKAITALASGDLRMAERLARRLLEADALDAAALDVVIESLVAQGDIPSAISESERAIRIAPHRSATHVTRARALLAAGRPQEALDAAKTAMGASPDVRAWHMLVIALRSTGDVLRAVEAAEEMEARYPDDAGGPLLLGGLAEDTGAGEDAVQAYGRAIRAMSPTDPRRDEVVARRDALQRSASPEMHGLPHDAAFLSGGGQASGFGPPERDVTSRVAEPVAPPPFDLARPHASGADANVPPPPPLPAHAPAQADANSSVPGPPAGDADDVIDLRRLTDESDRRALRVARWLDRLG